MSIPQQILIEYVTTAIKKWSPADHPTEARFTADLAAHLCRELPQTRVLAPFVIQDMEKDIGNSEVDIGVVFPLSKKGGLTVLIELKKNLRSKSELQRLRGQISEYSEHTPALFIVLCGETPLDFVKAIKADLAKVDGFHFGDLPAPLVKYHRLFVKRPDA